MFWGKDNPQPWLRPWRVWSMVGRMTFLHVITALVLFSIIIALLHRSMMLIITEENKLQLTVHLIELTNIIRSNPRDRQPWLEKIRLEEGVDEEDTIFFFQVNSSLGEHLAESYGMNLLAQAPFPDPRLKTEGEGTPVVLWQGPGNQWFLLAAKGVELGKNEESVILLVAVKITDDVDLVVSLRSTMILIMLTGALVSATTGAVLTRRGMKPLQDIMSAVGRVTAQRLDERIAPQGWPTELMGLAHAFDDMLSRLEDSFQRLARFSADLAHELRTPINNLQGEAEVILTKNRSPEEYQEVVASILEECQRLSRMVDSLLFLARAENPQTLVTKSPLDGGRELQSVVDFYSLLAEDHGVSLTCQGEGVIHGDAMLLRQAIGNLLINSLEYTPRGGQVVVSLQVQPDGSGQIVVRDSGCGIAAAHLPHIFDRFYRVEHDRCHGYQGVVHSGLGLAIVKSIALMHQGTVVMSSTPGVGSEVTLFLPKSAK